MTGEQPRRLGLFIAVAMAALALDVITKVVAVATLSNEPPVRLLGGLLTLRVMRNSGAAFSIGTGMTFVFTAIAVGVIVWILRVARRLRSNAWAVALGLLLGGAMGNLVDRLLRSPAPLKGHVVDWIELPRWPVFNLADSAIVGGGVLAVWLAYRGLQFDGTRATARQESSGAGRESAGRESAGREPGGSESGDGEPSGKGAPAEDE